MDPISIATAAGTASKTLYSISTTLYTFISSAKKVDKSLEALRNEVEAMARVLDSVQSVLKQPLILRAKAEVPGVDNVWTSTASAITDTQKTARMLQKLVKGLGTLDASPNVFWKAKMQLKLNFNSTDINEYQTLCQSHFNSLNVSLHLVTMLTHCQSHDDSKIISELNDLKKLVEDGQLNSDPGRFHALELKLPEELKNSDMLIHNQQLERAVESVIYAASSAIDSQSVVGSRLSELNPTSFEIFSELKPEDSASNVGLGRVGLLPRKADDGIKEWLTAQEIDETRSENTLKGVVSSKHNDAFHQGSNCSDDSVRTFRPLPSCPDSPKPDDNSAEQDSLDRALIALSRTKIVQNQSSIFAFLQDLVSNGVNLNAQDEDGLTAMHWASRKGHLAFVKFLCKRGADMNLKSNNGQSALNEAIAEGHTSIANFVLKHEAANIEQTGRHGRTPLICAARFGRLVILDLLLKCNADLSAKCESKNTALHFAAYYDELDCVKLLLQNKAPLASKNKNGWGPLHMAAWKGSNKCANHLINAGAPLEAKDSKGYTALSLAAYSGSSKVVEQLLNAGAKTDDGEWKHDWVPPIIEAADEGHNECVKLLLDAGALVEAMDPEGYTSLVAASQNGHIETIELLLNAGAKTDDREGKHDLALPLTMAASRGHHECVKLLLDAGALVGAVDPEGDTSLRVASRNGHVETTKLLLKAGAEVNSQNNGHTSLIYAAYHGHKDIIDLLLAAGAKTEPKGSYTVLFCVMMKHPDDCDQSFCSFCSGRKTRKYIIKYLCEKGADVSATNSGGWSLLKYLAGRGPIDQGEKKEIRKILKRFGAK